MLENIPIDLVNLLLFTMPGFFFVRAFSRSKKTDFEYFMFSMFWGILLMILFYKIFPSENFDSLLKSPYAGAIIFSISGSVIGFVLRKATLRQY